MVKQLFVKYTIPYLGILIASLLLLYSMNLSITLPITIFFAVYIGLAEFVILFISLTKHVHWFLHKEFDIITEVKQFILAYAFFLVVSIVTNLFINEAALLLVLALILPLLSLAAAIVYKFVEHHIIT